MAQLSELSIGNVVSFADPNRGTVQGVIIGVIPKRQTPKTAHPFLADVPAKRRNFHLAKTRAFENRLLIKSPDLSGKDWFYAMLAKDVTKL